MFVKICQKKNEKNNRRCLKLNHNLIYRMLIGRLILPPKYTINIILAPKIFCKNDPREHDFKGP